MREIEFSEPILNKPFPVIKQGFDGYKASLKDSFSREGWQLLSQVEQLAYKRRQNFASTSDLLLVLANQPTIQEGILAKLEVSSEEIETRVDRVIRPEYSVLARPEFLGYTGRLEQSLNWAVAKAQQEDRQVELNDLFYGLVRAKGFAAKVIKEMGMSQSIVKTHRLSASKCTTSPAIS